MKESLVDGQKPTKQLLQSISSSDNPQMPLKDHQPAPFIHLLASPTTADTPSEMSVKHTSSGWEPFSRDSGSDWEPEHKDQLETLALQGYSDPIPRYKGEMHPGLKRLHSGDLEGRRRLWM